MDSQVIHELTDTIILIFLLLKGIIKLNNLDYITMGTKINI
jgi:hypothetical protein